MDAELKNLSEVLKYEEDEWASETAGAGACADSDAGIGLCRDGGGSATN